MESNLIYHAFTMKLVYVSLYVSYRKERHDQLFLVKWFNQHDRLLEMYTHMKKKTVFELVSKNIFKRKMQIRQTGLFKKIAHD
jgi:hypothetical protein